MPTKRTSAPKLGDLFADFGQIVGDILAHPECPPPVRSSFSDMMSDIDGEACKFDQQQALRTQTEARTILPNNLTVMLLASRKKKGGK